MCVCFNIMIVRYVSNLNLCKAFLIGSIDEINHKISMLDRKLQSYHQLVVESRASQQSSEDYQSSVAPPNSARNKEKYMQKGNWKYILIFYIFINFNSM